MVAPCNCCNLRIYVCCGTPCYEIFCSQILFSSAMNGEEFLTKWKAALNDYFEKHDIDKKQMPIFRRVADRFCSCDSVKTVGDTPLVPLVMDRDGNIEEQTEVPPVKTILEEAYAVPNAVPSTPSTSATRSTVSEKTSRATEGDGIPTIVEADPLPHPPPAPVESSGRPIGLPQAPPARLSSSDDDDDDDEESDNDEDPTRTTKEEEEGWYAYFNKTDLFGNSQDSCC